MDYQELLNELEELEFINLIHLYFEAKTGFSGFEEWLPAYLVTRIYEVDEIIKDVINGLS